MPKTQKRASRNEYHRKYQKDHYDDEAKEAKREYYQSNRTRVLSRLAYTRMASVFRSILV